VRVVLPAILPGVFTLLRMNFIAAWMAVLVAEMVGLRDGLGAIIMMGRNLFNSDLIMLAWSSSGYRASSLTACSSSSATGWCGGGSEP